MSHRTAMYIVLIILVVIGAISALAALGMWLMSAAMMGGAMSGCCGVAGAGFWLIGLLILAGIVAAAVLLMRREPRP